MDAYLKLANGETRDAGVKAVSARSPGVTAVWVSGSADRPLNSGTGAVVGFDVGGMTGWMAQCRYCDCWCRPQFGTDPGDIPDETQGLVCAKSDGSFTVILPLVSERYKCVLSGGDGRIRVKLFSWYEGLCDCDAPAFIRADGDDPFRLAEECVRAGLELLQTDCRPREDRHYPELFEYLGWCSWDAFEIRVDEKGVLEKCREFREKGIPVRWVLLDDMWAEVRDFYGVGYKDRPEMFRLMHGSKLFSFRADPVRFPHGLDGCISRIREYGMKTGVWHTANGYWAGLDPDGDAFRTLRTSLIRAENGRYVPDWRRDGAYAFYSAFHDAVKACGAEFVKIDNQSSMTARYYRGLAPVGEAARSFHAAMEASVAEHFGDRAINCMGMASEDLWNRSASPLARCSDDFQPENRAWFTKHVLQCAYNCVFQGQFYTCDWDMWWTDDGQAVKNAVLRAVSGGPVYISDPLHRSRPEILRPLMLSDGRILRCDRPGMPAKDCLVTDSVTDGRIFKVQNVCGPCGVVAVFDLDGENRPVSGSVSPADVEGLGGERFGVYEHFSKEFRVLSGDESLRVTLRDGDDFRLYVFVPLTDGCGMIGRTDKYISPKTVRYDRAGSAALIEEGPYAFVEDGELVFAEG